MNEPPSKGLFLQHLGCDMLPLRPLPRGTGAWGKPRRASSCPTWKMHTLTSWGLLGGSTGAMTRGFWNVPRRRVSGQGRRVGLAVHRALSSLLSGMTNLAYLAYLSYLCDLGHLTSLAQFPLR